MRNKRRKLTCWVKKIDLQEVVRLDYPAEFANTEKTILPKGSLDSQNIQTKSVRLVGALWTLVTANSVSPQA